MRAQVITLTTILLLCADAKAVKPVDCNDKSVICAAGSPWYQATESKTRFSSAGSSDYAEYRFVFSDSHSASIEFDTMDQGKSQAGKIVLVSGRIMLTKGFSPAKGHEIDSLDLPNLNHQLVVTLLSQAFPAGPDKFEGKRTVDLAEQKRGIKIATMSAVGLYSAPWTLKGEMQRRNVETIDFSLRFSFEVEGAAHDILISGEWKKAATAPRLDASMSLKGWSLYALGGVSIKQQGATILDYAAQPEGAKLKTLGELQEAIRKHKVSGSGALQLK